ncbi:anthranilate synthase component I family protein [Namhaeicola litoreus]|uniref:Anthranilate synthase component I family protein n=1 Tax=Namhaeicola litoreus TaxID=1052145 RepID=A0ABW3XYB1_9FLAO
MRIQKDFKAITIPDLKLKLLNWAQQEKVFLWCDSNTHLGNQTYETYDAVLAIGVQSELKCSCENAFEKLKQFRKVADDYVFGYLSYDLKNDIEALSSQNFDGVGFDDLYFFQPQKIIFLQQSTLSFSYLNEFEDEMEKDFQKIQNSNFNVIFPKTDIHIQQRISTASYQEKLKNILAHIHRGDIYEVNFCQEFYAEDCEIHPLTVYSELNSISTPPFATFLRINDKYLLSASPERFVKKIGSKVISQPIKGTARRSSHLKEDEKIKAELSKDPKERSENIMIVDLVRNDLSKTAIKGSVRVEELCKVYTFQQVHQLISTVVSEVSDEIDVIDIIISLFPMGSMTGAPKISAMEIIEELEETKRGLYSGAVGYFSPENDFDFNVVIRSILYNATRKYVSFSVGGAITAQSKIENEYNECMLKAEAMKKALNQK